MRKSVCYCESSRFNLHHGALEWEASKCDSAAQKIGTEGVQN
ncbi:hypothetical protein DAI22_10g091902 [Oryza sativa Japonica Group]|nr:hypothetical protein DAI22_10g091902 [Oryza sativa Japonica Group]